MRERRNRERGGREIRKILMLKNFSINVQLVFAHKCS